MAQREGKKNSTNTQSREATLGEVWQIELAAGVWICVSEAGTFRANSHINVPSKWLVIYFHLNSHGASLHVYFNISYTCFMILN